MSYPFLIAQLMLLLFMWTISTSLPILWTYLLNYFVVWTLSMTVFSVLQSVKHSASNLNCKITIFEKMVINISSYSFYLCREFALFNYPLYSDNKNVKRDFIISSMLAFNKTIISEQWCFNSNEVTKQTEIVTDEKLVNFL